jgi:hypothetical protein
MPKHPHHSAELTVKDVHRLAKLVRDFVRAREPSNTAPSEEMLIWVEACSGLRMALEYLEWAEEHHDMA